MVGLLNIFGIFLIVYFILLIFSTIKVHSVQTTDVEPKIEIIELSDIPQDIILCFNKDDDDLGKILFESIFYLKYIFSKNLISYIRFYINYHESDTAMAVFFKQKINNKVNTISYYEYQSDFNNGYCILTNNSNQPSIFKRDSKIKIKKYQKVKDPIKLYDKHKQQCQLFKSTSYKTVPKKGDELNSIITAFKRDIQYQVTYGYYYLDKINNVYRLTWKGAIVHTFKIFTRMIFKVR